MLEDLQRLAGIIEDLRGRPAPRTAETETIEFEEIAPGVFRSKNRKPNRLDQALQAVDEIEKQFSRINRLAGRFRHGRSDNR